MFSGINKGNHHHAYLLEGERDVILPELFVFLQKEFNISRARNPDLLIWEGETFSIDDARELRTKDKSSAFLGEKKVFIVATAAIGHEAQHALLKTLEEPSKESIIFVVAATKEALFPTVRSRMQHLRRKDIREIKEEISAQKFFSGSIKERMLLVKTIVEDKDKEKAKTFVDYLVLEYHKDLHKDPRYMSSLLEAKRYLFDRSASLKLILEHLALTSPSISKSE